MQHAATESQRAFRLTGGDADIAPQNVRLGYLAKIEAGEWIATLGGYGRDFPRPRMTAFFEFARLPV